jgi:HlyD family secretion protein
MMKFVVLVGSVAVAGAAVAGMALRERALFPFGAGDAQRRYLGYVEGETTLVAPPTAGRLVARPLRRGDRVSKGETLFAIDTAQPPANSRCRPAFPSPSKPWSRKPSRDTGDRGP